MQLIENIKDIQETILKAKKDGKTVGFVPTMGYLHKGHLSLLESAKSENDIVVLSIFVNPTQFAPAEDLDNYPRDIERDKYLAEKYGTDIIFFPTSEIMYPQGYASYVIPEKLDLHLCGEKRPGHFKGVMTVVLKLFNIVTPDNVYFGQKDIQQARIIEQMIEDFNLNINMHIMPIIRESDGLAMSSRNVYLNDDERIKAVALSQGLNIALGLYNNGIKDAVVLKNTVLEFISKTDSGIIDYIELVDYSALEPIVEKIERKAILAVAVYFGETRLIDNIILM